MAIASIIYYIYICTNVYYCDTAKHQRKPQVYKTDIAPCGHIKPVVKTDYKKTSLLSLKCRQKGRKSNRHQQRFCLSGNIPCLLVRVLYQIYNHLVLGPTALILDHYKSDIASTHRCVMMYTYIIYMYIYIYIFIYLFNTQYLYFYIIIGTT